jgi:hypothetical protein
MPKRVDVVGLGTLKSPRKPADRNSMAMEKAEKKTSTPIIFMRILMWLAKINFKGTALQKIRPRGCINWREVRG